MSSLSKRLAYLGLADFDYLSARLLSLCGLGNTAFPKAAEAFEKLFKLFLMLEAKITRNEDLGPKDLRAYSHDLVKLFHAVKTKIPATFDGEWDAYFTELRDAYNRRYPEHWREFVMEVNVHKLDLAYTYLRNGVARNFPVEERTRARHFGTFIYDAYNAKIVQWIRSLGGLAPEDILRLNNESLETLEIDFSRL